MSEKRQVRVGPKSRANTTSDGSGNDDCTEHVDQQSEPTSSISDIVESLKTSLHSAKKQAPDVWSLHDTLWTMLDHHHENLNNFQVAGDALEAGAQLYGKQVDSLASNVQRMSVLFNKPVGIYKSTPVETPDSRIRRKKRMTTIATNKLTLNAKLETVEILDPIFTNFKRDPGDVTAPSHLMVNLMGSKEAELLLKRNTKFWDSSELEKIDYTADYPLTPCGEMIPFPPLLNDINYEELRLQPHLSHYRIVGGTSTECSDAPFSDNSESSMAFDMNAACQALQLDDEEATSTSCKAVDADSSLVYSNRPLEDPQASTPFTEDKNTLSFRCSQAGFTETSEPSMVFDMQFDAEDATATSGTEDVISVDTNANVKYSSHPSGAVPLHWLRSKRQPSSHLSEDDNKPSTSKHAIRSKHFRKHRTNVRKDTKLNAQKQSSPISLLLPADLQTESEILTQSDPILEFPDPNEVEEHIENQHNCMDVESFGSTANITAILKPLRKRVGIGAIKQSTKEIIHQQLHRPVEGEQAPQHPEKTELYEEGVTSFTEVHKELEDSLGPVTTAMTMLSILQVASDENLRLIPQECREDFKIRKIRD